MKKRIVGLIFGVLFACAFSLTASAGGNITAPKPQVQSNLFENQYELSEADIDLMAATVYYEANTEDMQGKRLVCSVILNRMESDSFPNDVQGVISYKNAFQTYKFSKNMNDTDIPIDCYGAVLAELEERTDYAPLYFSSEGYNGSTPLYKYGNHYFSK